MHKFFDMSIESGKKLPVMETFLSIQGEGFHTGTPSFFIRIGGCDVGCHWCDVKESWDPEKHPLVDVESIIEQIPDTVETVVLTGGEPTSYNLTYLVDLLHRQGKKIHLETSGTGTLPEKIDWLCLSPKKFELPKPGFYNRADELKIIVYNKSDLQFALEQAGKVPGKTRLFLQPEWSRRREVLDFILEFLIRNPAWKLSVQTHKYIGLP